MGSPDSDPFVEAATAKKDFEAAACCRSPKSLGLLLFPGVKSKQVLVSMLALLCGILLLLKNPMETVQYPVLSLVPKDEELVNSASNMASAPSSTVETPPQQNQTTACDYTRGRWIKDNTRPLYSGRFCSSWLSDAWHCRRDKQRNLSYEGYRWQPAGCDLPAFDATQFLHRLRGKTIAFIGDSLGRQQYQSLMCMLADTGTTGKIVDVSSSYRLPKGWGQKFSRTNTTVLYHWSATLGNEVFRGNDTALHVDRVPAFLSGNIDRLDVVVLNTGHHWNRGKIKLNKWSLHFEGKPARLTVGEAREKAVRNSVKWLDQVVKRRPDFQAFMRTLSPRHFTGGEWNTGGRCDNIKAMDEQALEKFVGDSVVEDAVRSSRGVKLLDITYLSKSRGEAHVSDFLSKSSRQDCLHWCLPGVPDSWNELLYAYLADDTSQGIFSSSS